ncbi:hypothetical protein [Deinococcus hopiensis]|nr:hypothetical protein [Deinococcus hopiensis]
MKRLALLALLGGTITSCSTLPPRPALRTLRVVTLATAQPVPLVVRNITRNKVVFEGSVTGSKKISALPGDETYFVIPQPVEGYAVPAGQQVVLTSDITITFAYTVPVSR